MDRPWRQYLVRAAEFALTYEKKGISKGMFKALSHLGSWPMDCAFTEMQARAGKPKRFSAMLNRHFNTLVDGDRAALEAEGFPTRALAAHWSNRSNQQELVGDVIETACAFMWLEGDFHAFARLVWRLVAVVRG